MSERVAIRECSGVIGAWGRLLVVHRLGRLRILSHERTTEGVKCEACSMFFFFQAEDGIRDLTVTGVQTCALPISPKPGWTDTDLVAALETALGVPIAFDTDVNAAALGEQRWGAAVGLDTFCYLTVGTGIGGGVMAGGQLVHGLVHPEVGHMLIPHDRQRDPFQGACPFHQDCFEGLASG